MTVMMMKKKKMMMMMITHSLTQPCTKSLAHRNLTPPQINPTQLLHLTPPLNPKPIPLSPRSLTTARVRTHTFARPKPCAPKPHAQKRS